MLMLRPVDLLNFLYHNQINFELQKPYDKSPSERYSFNNGVHRFWVFANDKPHTPTSNTKPRSEIRIPGYDYSSGVWQFEGEAYIPSGTDATSVMQVFGGSSRAATVMLRVYSGKLTVYNSPTVLQNIYNRWFKVNIIHDVEASNVKVHIDGIQYIKFGVYAEDGASHRLESHWRRIRILKKN